MTTSISAVPVADMFVMQDTSNIIESNPGNAVQGSINGTINSCMLEQGIRARYADSW